MECPSCGADAVVDGHCTMCGVDVVYVCDDCGRASPVDVAFCAGCGARLTTLRQKGAAARPALTGARRVTTVLMTDLSGFTAMGERHDPEDVAELMTTIRDEGARIIESYGGTVNQFIGDEIVAVFGIPAAADDDARRAVLAAMDLHDRIDELNQTSEIARTSPLAMHSGLQTGLLVVGSRDERNGRYELTGDTINTAARLLNIADRGEVVVGDKTRELVAPYFDVESKGEHVARGKKAPLPAFRVARRPEMLSRFEAAQASGLLQLQGRSADLDRLRDLAQGAADGTPVSVLVSGEAGIGKSRLAHDFVAAETENRRGLLHLQGRCQSFGTTTSFLPFIDVLGAVLADDDPSGVGLEQRLEAIDPDLMEFAPAYRYLLSLSTADDLPAAWQDGSLPEILQQAIVSLVDRVTARQPTIVQLDDWHWADQLSRQVLGRILASTARSGVILVTSRPHVDPQLDAIDHRFTLTSLSRADTESMIGAAFDADVVEPALATAVFERTHGNPLFVEELSRQLRDRDHVRLVAGQLLLRGSASAPELPDTVQAVVLGRADRLPAAARDLLRVASVVGREFEVAVLASVTGEPHVDTTLDQLSRDGFIEPMRGSDSRFRFRHINTQSAIYETLLMKERRQLHHAIGTLIEERQSEPQRQQRLAVEELARHFSRSDDTDRAIHYLEQAGLKALERLALIDAAESFRLAVETTKRGEQTKDRRKDRARIALKWAEAGVFLPSPSQVEAMNEVLAETLEDGDLRSAVFVGYWITWLQYSIGEQDQAATGTELLLAQLEAADEVAMADLARSHLGMVRIAQRRDRDAEALLYEGTARRRAALESGEQLRSAANGMYCYSMSQAAMVHACQGDFDRARSLLDEVLQLASDGAVRTTEASILVCLGLSATLAGRWEEVGASMDRLNGIPEVSISPYVRHMTDVLRAYADVNLIGSEALPALRRAVAIHHESEAKLALVFNLSLLADALLEHGFADEATETAHAALRQGASGDRFGDEMAMSVLARAGATSGASPDPALAELLELARTRRSAHGEGMAALAAADAHRRAGDTERAAAAAAVAVEQLGAIGADGYAERARRILAEPDTVTTSSLSDA